MMEGGSLRKKKGASENQDHDFSQLIFSWSLDDILNENLYEHQVEKIPLTFQSEEHYFRSFVYPLLEETRCELASNMKIMYRAPFAEVCSLSKARGKGKVSYDVTVGTWRTSGRRKEPYRTLPGDLFILAYGEPESVSDLQSAGSKWVFLLVNNTGDDYTGCNSTSVQFNATASQEIEFHDRMFVVFLMNITTQKRVWNSLHKHVNLDIIKEILYPASVVKEKCDMCSIGFSSLVQIFDPHLLYKLNESQRAAVMASICKMECCHNSSVEQIWGPPGTGKTMTVSVMLFALLQLKCRTLTCAPTNVAIVQVASRVLSLVKDSIKTGTESGDSFYSIGDLLLFGNKERLKVGTNIEEIYLERRVEKLTECLGSLTGWRPCMRSMIDLLEDCSSQYHVFVENELFKEKQLTNEKKSKTNNLKVKSFMEFLRDRFSASAVPLRRCIDTLCTHIPRRFMGHENFQTMVSLLHNLSSLESFLTQKNLVSEELEHIFVSKPLEPDFVKLGHMSSINSVRIMSLSCLKTLCTSFGRLKFPSGNEHAVTHFCYGSASLIFCTTSTSYKLQKFKMEPFKLLVIDEAAQMKESDSIIPLQSPGVKHAILIGDECQLPATVRSNVSSESGFGRSLFERLSLLGHSKHLLNVQYRMHPTISFFPNWKFYQSRLLDAENVTCKSYGKQYLSGPMFGSYSFINVVGGKEEGDDVGSKRNMVEVSIVIKIVDKLYKEWNQFKKKLSIGVVSPYTAQVVSIEEKLRYKYEKCDGFSVTVKSIDGFQGGEEDIIILSTVRSNSHGSVGFMSSPQRTNVALTRARHCLWILGNERTLARSDSIWKELVCDARNRHCLFDADADECLKKIIIAAKKELEPLHDLGHGNSLLLKHVKWKVLFSDNFRKSFGKLMNSRMKNLVVDLLQKLSGGWQPTDGNSGLKVIKIFKVEGFHVICTIDIIKELKYTQVLKVWDILPLKEIPKLRKQLENVFAAYTNDYMNHCAEKCFEGNLENPKSWVASQEIIQFRKVSNCKGGNEVSMSSDVDNSEVSESLLYMKFYFLSPGMVDHLRFGRDIDLPMQLSDEQMGIFLCPKSSFIIGQLGTGKTTILTMKLLQKEQSFRATSEVFYEAKVVDDHEENKPTVLRQLFVTTSPRSCYAVKQHVSHLTSSSRDENLSAEINLDDADVTSDFDLPDTFVDISEKSYPLVITFHKFLMMLDGTLGNSFFERFNEAREGSQCNHISRRSVAFETFLRSKTVTFDRFSSRYWPYFETDLTKKLDPSRVFTEIVSHIKGGLQAGESHDGKLSYEGYCLVPRGRASTLTKRKRETVYTLFQAYEKMKTEREEFDVGDLVIDHNRLKNMIYEGDHMDFIYIDEVQDLSTSQISLFKYICQNVDEGFVFAGDTAQTIARGIDFQFEDVRSLFYIEFLGTRTADHVSEIFQLKNSRTRAGVLNLAQSVIDILYYYFAHSIDILEPETSLISGEAPILLKSGKDKNTIQTIFGGTGTMGNCVGFGAEQVILVRDDYAKIEICEYVGKQALVLTIVECKGLEFQDVLLYNFFGSSPLKDQWKVVYGYMKEQNWLDEALSHSFPSFKESKHNILCSELKQLYIAITRTRQRLWICENKEELSKPMFEYWKKKGLVQERKLNDSVAQAMQGASSPQEWLERGKKLFYENVFVMATMCFERAGDSMWEKLAKASALRTSADQMRGINLEASLCYLREAAEMFESIGKLESAATCYCDLGEHERAGKIYLDKCDQINAAAECFKLAGCYSDAAEAYAKGDQFSNCLSVCIKGKLFEKGLQYIEYWKEHVNVWIKEIEQIEQEFLESCALDYHEHNDTKSMMKFVTSFCSMESKRAFLRSIGRLDDLLLLEEESGHFLDAAELAGSRGDVMKEAVFLEKGGRFVEATLLILWYVFTNSLWGNGNTAWPLNHFAQKKELCKKAKSLAKMDSLNLYDFVCSEVKVLTNGQRCLSKLKKQLHASKKHKSLRGEFLSIRQILDAHLQLNTLKYDWEDELPVNTNKYVEEKISHNRVSVRTLVFYFNLWKENVMEIFQSLGSLENAERLENAEPNEHEGHVNFCLNYFGVREQCVEGNIVYLLVNKDFDWIKNVGDHKGLHRQGEILTLDGKRIALAIRSYWQTELVSVGMKVLETLQSLCSLTLKSSAFHQSTSLLHIFEVSKFLLDCQYLNLMVHHTKTLQLILDSSITYFDFVFPLDWRRSVSPNLISLRETDLSLNLLDRVILQNINIEGGLTHWTIGRVMMICLGSRKSKALYEKIVKGVQWNPQWKSFVERFWEDGFNDVYVAPALQNALEDTYRAYWWFPGYMSPHSFVYLVDRLLFMASFSTGVFFTTKSSFVEWNTHLSSMSTPLTTLSASKQIFSKDVADFIVRIVQYILYNKEETVSWIERSNIVASYYHPLMAMKLVTIISLISLQLLDCSQVVIDLLLGWNNIAYLLPLKFVGDLLRRRNGCNLNLNPDMVAEAFVSIEDPLVIVSSENGTPRVHAPCAIFVDLTRPRAEIMKVLFPSKTALGRQTSSESNNALKEKNHVEETGDEHSNGDHSLEEKQSSNNSQDSGSKTGMGKKSGSNIQNTIATVLLDGQSYGREGSTLHESNNSWDGLTTLQEENYSWDDLKQPSSASDMSQPEVELSVSTSGKRTTVKTTAKSVMGREWKVVQKVGSESSATAEVFQKEQTGDEHSNGDRSLKEKQSSNNSQDSGSKTGMGKNSVSNIQNTTATVLLDGQSCGREGSTLHESNNSWDGLTTLQEAKNSWDGLTTLQEENYSWDDQKQPSFPSDTRFSQPEVELSVSTSGKRTTVKTTAKSVMVREWKVVQKVGSESSNTTEVFQMEQTGDEHSNGDHSLVELVLEKQSSKETSLDEEIKKGKGKKKGKWIKKKKGSVNTLTSVLVDRQLCAVEDTKTLWEANTGFNDSKHSSASDTSEPAVELSVSKSDEMYLQAPEERLQSSRRVVDGLLNQSFIDPERKAVQKVVGSEGSNTTAALQEENHVKQTVDEPISNGDHSLVLEKQSSNKNTQDAEIKKGKGKNNWIEKNKNSNSLTTFTGDEHTSNDHPLVELVLEKVVINKNNENVEIKKGKAKNIWIKKEKGSNNLSSFTGDEHSSNDHSPVELALKKIVINKNNENVKIKKGKAKNILIKKEKGSNSLSTFTGDEHSSNDHSLMELALEKVVINKNNKNVEIKKGKAKNIWIKKEKGSNSLSTFTTVLVDGQQATTLHRANSACNDLKQSFCASDTSRPEVDILVSVSDETMTVQSSNAKTQDTENKKRKGNNRRKKSTVQLDGQPCARVDTTLVACNDLKQPYFASDTSGSEVEISLLISNITEALQELNLVGETNDELNNDDDSLMELVLEKQTSNDNTQDAENKKGKGKYVAKEHTSMCEANDLQPSSAFDMRINTMNAIKCGTFLGLTVALLGIRSWRKT